MILIYFCTHVALNSLSHIIQIKAINDMLEKYFMTFSQFPSTFTYNIYNTFTYKGFFSELEAEL